MKLEIEFHDHESEAFYRLVIDDEEYYLVNQNGEAMEVDYFMLFPLMDKFFKDNF